MQSQNWLFRGTTHWAFGRQLSRFQVITLTFASVCSMLLGIIGILGSGFNIYSGLDSENWVEQRATILNFEAEALKGKSKGKYKISLTYEFQFEGKTYTSNQIRMTDQIFFEEEAQKLIKKCKGKNTVVAFVNPQNPTISVIEKGLQIGEIVLLVVTLCAFLCGVWFFKVLYFK